MKEDGPSSTSDSINHDGNMMSPILRREKSFSKRRKYVMTPSASPPIATDTSPKNNVCYIRSKVDPGILRQRINKQNQEQLRLLQRESYMKTLRSGETKDLHNRVRAVTYPGGTSDTNTTIKVISASKSPQNCCSKTPMEHYHAVMAASASGGLRSFDEFLVQSSKNLGRVSSSGRRRFSSTPLVFTKRRASNYRKTSLDIVREEEEPIF